MPHPRYRRPAQFLFTHHGRRLSQNAVRAELDRAADVAGLDHITPHQLRHTYATALVNAGVSLQALMALLGHMSAEMSLRYGRLFDTTVRAEYERALDLAKQQATHTRAPAADQPAAGRHHRRRRLEGHPAAQVPAGRRVLPTRTRPGRLRLRQHLRTLPQLPRRTQLTADPRRPTRRRRSTRRATPRQRGWIAEAERHHQLIARLDTLISEATSRMTTANTLNRVERACAELPRDGTDGHLHRRRRRHRPGPHHPLPRPHPARRHRRAPPPRRRQRHPDRPHRRDRHPPHRRRQPSPTESATTKNNSDASPHTTTESLNRPNTGNQDH